ncbi:MAG: tetratricopeptide repeat protein [Phycisphaerales bacterium JB038]
MDRLRALSQQAKKAAQAGDIPGALRLVEPALKASPNSGPLNQLMASIHLQAGKHGQAEPHIRRALKAAAKGPAPLRANLNQMLAISLQGQRRLRDAESAYRRALALNPQFFEAQLALSGLQVRRGRFAEARELLDQAIALKPDDARGYTQLAGAFFDAGRYQEALTTLERGLAAGAADVSLLQARAFALNYSDDATPESILEAHQAFGAALMAGAAPPDAPPVEIDPERTLRLGVLSPDLRTHSCAYFLEPLLQHHDPTRIELHLYAAHDRIDATTERLRAASESFTQVFADGDERLAQRLREDRLDILIDLAGLSHGSRVAALRFRPAPLQMTFLGYPNTTGLPTVDYRIVDARTDPEGSLASETLLRLDGCFLCYQPPDDAPPVEAPPVTTGQPLTFGSFNAIGKITPSTVSLWRRILEAVPEARLLLKNRRLDDARVRQDFQERLREQGLPLERLELLPGTEGRAEHLRTYHRLDIALDTHPYNGTTTTFEALLMGVPVLALCGDRHAARVSYSNLANLGLEDLCAENPEDLVRAAVSLAGDVDRLQALRQDLRGRLRNSALCDGAAYADNFTAALRQVWRQWCARTASQA